MANRAAYQTIFSPSFFFIIQQNDFLILQNYSRKVSYLIYADPDRENFFFVNKSLHGKDKKKGRKNLTKISKVMKKLEKIEEKEIISVKLLIS